MSDRVDTLPPMFRHIYYRLKPYLPWRIRIAIRRSVASRVRDASRQIWPIDHSAARPPENWPGWPGGKKFAFVITHDVESHEGLARCLRLADLDRSMGFRSSFNLVPIGDYNVPSGLRDSLVEKGFEVGVHDLHHDGKLYDSRKEFRESAGIINRYLKEWGAAGFRSGFMLHRNDWLHDLQIEYDASTFDTDPFEPQSDAAGIIFPFWVPRDYGDPNGKGYIELPYTLPQDSTLFLIFREKSPAIWLNKLDWVAAQNGMALVNVHPDYIQFPGEAPNKRTFPVEHYIRLLEHVRTRYEGTYWQPLARDLARAVAPFRPRHAIPVFPGRSHDYQALIRENLPLAAAARRRLA